MDPITIVLMVLGIASSIAGGVATYKSNKKHDRC